MFFVVIILVYVGGVILHEYNEKQAEKRVIEAFRNSDFEEDMQNIVSDYEDQTDAILNDMEKRK